MRCLCCGKDLGENEKKDGWHKRCIKSFFNIPHMPELDISDKVLDKIANENVNKGMTIPGVQKKISVHLSKDNKYRLTIVGYPNGYILKPQSDDYMDLPEAEYLCMQMAKEIGIETVKNGLIKIKNQYAYITKRLDRGIIRKNNDEIINLYAMEDFCQLSGRLTNDKYKGSYEQCAKIIGKYSCRPGLDMAEFFLRLVFCFVTGNSDMHLKNFSLIEKKPKDRNYVLSPAYDLLPVNIIIPEDDEEMALMMCGRKKNFHRKHFLEFAENISIQKNAAERMIKKIVSHLDVFIKMCDESFISQEMKESMKELMIKRVDVIA